VVRLSAALVDDRLRERLALLDDGSLSIAEINRRIGAAADELGLMRPSYSRIRLLVHEGRNRRRRVGPSTARVLVDISTRARPPEHLLDHISGVGVPELWE
jgi:hypothetical protein